MRTYIAIGLALVALPAHAGTPLLLTHHGRLTYNDDPVNGGTDVTFRLYDGSSATSYQWEESMQVICQDGYYTVHLGMSTPLDPALLIGVDALWLGITVSGADELTPRLRVTAVPYAMVASTAEVAHDVDCLDCINAPSIAFNYAISQSEGGPASDVECPGCIETQDIKNGAVSFAKLAACPPSQLLRAGTAGLDCTTDLTIDDAGVVTVPTVLDIGLERIVGAACSGDQCESRATCPAGKSLLGGGCNFTSCSETGYERSYPEDTTTWYCRSNRCTQSTPYALCGRIQ